VFLFITALIVLGGGIICLLIPAARLWGALAVLISLVVTLLSSMSTVPTKNVGIVTSFSKPTGRTTGAGLQWTAPWQNVDDWDASGQTYAHLGDACVWLTIAAQRRACIPVQVEYSSKAETAPENWAAYKQVGDKSRFETWVARRVDPQINAAMTSVFAGFDPLTVVDPKSGDAPAPDLNKLYRQPLLDALTASLGKDVSLRSVAFEAPRYDQPTTAAIAAYGQKILESRNLKIDQKNAEVRKAIAGQSGLTPFQQACLETAKVNGGQPGLCGGGGGGSVIVGSTK